MATRKEAFKIGDLVKCIYDLFDHYDYVFDQPPYQGYPFYGIVIDIHNNIIDEKQYDYDKLYIVRCFDGHIRFFACWEMRVISTSS